MSETPFLTAKSGCRLLKLAWFEELSLKLHFFIHRTNTFVTFHLYNSGTTERGSAMHYQEPVTMSMWPFKTGMSTHDTPYEFKDDEFLSLSESLIKQKVMMITISEYDVCMFASESVRMVWTVFVNI